MSETASNLLYLMAEISIATVALSGITMVLAVTNAGLTRQRAALISIQLRMAVVVTACSIFPLLLVLFDLPGDIFWRVASGFYLLSVFANTASRLSGPASLSVLSRSAAILVRCTALSAITLLPLNLWLATSWPYLTQLCIAWSVSTLIFLGFIHEVLSDAQDNASSNQPGKDTVTHLGVQDAG